MQPQELEILKAHTEAINALVDTLKSESFGNPKNKEFWNSQECATQLGIESKVSFAQYVAPLPDFPAPVPIPTTRSKTRQHRLWVAQEVIEWALSNRDKLQARRKARKVID